MTGEEYDEDYFENGIPSGKSLYENYRWLPDLTISMAHHIAKIMQMEYDETVLDMGCAKGYLVKAFRLLGYDAYGVDISSYAISMADDMVREYVRLVKPLEDFKLPVNFFEHIVCKDVLEHVPYNQIDGTLKLLRSQGKQMFAIIPLGDGNSYIVPAYELDITHKIRESLDWWIKQFKAAGFTIKFVTLQCRGIKGNWAMWKGGNGFFLLV